MVGIRGGEGGEREERAEDVEVSEAEARDFRFREGYRDSSVVVGERGSNLLLRLAAVEVAVVFRALVGTGLEGIWILSNRGVWRSSKAPSMKATASASRFAKSRGFIAGLVEEGNRAGMMGLSKDSVVGNSGDKAAFPGQLIQSTLAGSW